MRWFPIDGGNLFSTGFFFFFFFFLAEFFGVLGRELIERDTGFFFIFFYMG